MRANSCPILIYSFFLILFGCGPSLPPAVVQEYATIPEKPDFNRDIRPILSDRCFPCHGPDQSKLEAGLRLDEEQSAKGKLPEHPDRQAIRPGNPAASELVRRILETDPEWMMPPPDSKLSLSDREKALLIKWIDQGAEYKEHWAFIKPQKGEVPAGTNAIDFYIKKKLKTLGLSVSEAAGREILLRRLTFDLTGLPPSLAEVDEFLKDQNDDAYERVVERLLNSPRFGERMAVDWLDVARYADTHGYTVDRFRDVSPYRDWVIRSFNANMPYDQFVTWQLAGDLLPGNGKEQNIATAFLRLHPQNMEGGIVPEEFRVEYVADRTNTFGTAFMGMTLSCAKCHDHKFDPISQKDYYQLFSFFNNINEAGQISFNDAMPVPTMLMTNEKQDSVIRFLDQKISELEGVKERAEKEFLSGPSLQRKKKDWDTRLVKEQLSRSMVGYYPLDHELVNRKDPRVKGKMDRTNSTSEKPNFMDGYRNEGLLLDGDAWLDLGGVGAFDRYQPFTVSMFIKLPSGLSDGVIFHRGIGAVLYNFRGFHLSLKDNRLEMLMAHTAPDNAIVRYSDRMIPRDQWIHLAMVYDGTGKADGLDVYLNGEPIMAVTQTDNLYKSLNFDFGGQKEPGIQIGARWRGKGIGGAVVDEIRIFDRFLSGMEIKTLFNDEYPAQWSTLDSSRLSENQQQEIAQFLLQCHPEIQAIDKELLAWRKKKCEFTDTLPELMVFKEMSQARPAYILDRGQYDIYKEQVWPSTPEAILMMDTTQPDPDRLDLARWLFSSEHPLTARVFVNRIWQQFFGKGLVRTAEDFGNQGSAPSHPELLDHLAVDFREDGWDIKDLIRTIVLSETYRQSSVISELAREKDPENLFLSRGPSRRLSAEMIRDQALFASGLLQSRIGGPSVFPYQPEGLWKVNGAAYPQGTGEDLYRRSLYTVWKRSVPHPTQSTFDAPERSECSMRRQQTNTPLQALVLMNDPIFVEASIALGVQMYEEKGFGSVFRQLTGRKATNDELEELQGLYQDNLNTFIGNPDRARGWMKDVISGSRPNLPAAAYAVVASTIMNTDASIFKR